MKVSTLKEYLKNIPDDVTVYMASDAEGNDFSELSDDIEADFNGSSGLLVLYPLHDRVGIDYGYCRQCEHNHLSIVDFYSPNSKRCGVCGQPVENYKEEREDEQDNRG